MRSDKKIQRNLVVGLASQVLTIVLGVFIPRLVITNYGSEINGLLSSVTQVYSYVALLEAGVGTATVQALYGRLARDDKDGINAVLAATNHYYHRTGALYLLAIVLFSVLYPLFVQTEIPAVTVVLVIVLNGLGSVINYYFQAKYFLLLQAEGKTYVKESFAMFTNVFKNVAKIVLITLGFGVVFVQAIAMVVSIMQMLYVSWYIRRGYIWIDLGVEPDFDSISQSKNVLIHQVSGLVFNSTDNITLTLFTGLKAVSVYSMYSLFYGMVNTLQVTLSGSVVFFLGQRFHGEREDFMRYYDCYELYYCAVSFALYTAVSAFILPFLRVYTAGVSDTNYIDPHLPYMFALIGMLSCIRNAPNNVIAFAGHFKQTQNRSIAETVINLSVSLVAVQFMGIYGVLLGSIVAMLYRSNDIIIYANRRILDRPLTICYKRVLVLWVTYLAVQLVTLQLNIQPISYASVLISGSVYFTAVLAIYIAAASLIDVKTARFAFGLLESKLHVMR